MNKLKMILALGALILLPVIGNLIQFVLYLFFILFSPFLEDKNFYSMMDTFQKNIAGWKE